MKNFIKQAMDLLKSGTDQEKQVKNASRKAENYLNQVLSKLESEKVDADITIEEAENALKDAKFSILWLTDPQQALWDIDRKELALDEAKAHLDSLNFSIEKRKALLAEYSK